MARCPKCDKHIKVYQMSPYCNNCGVHLMFASFEGQFEKDRRLAEMSMAYFRYNFTKLKSAYISGKAQKFKIFASLVPLLALFIPFGALTVDTTVYSLNLSYNAIGLIFGALLGDGLFGKLDGLAVTPVFGDVAASLKMLILIYLISAVGAVLVLLLELLSFIGNKKVCVLTSLFSVVGLISTLASGFMASSLTKVCEAAGSMVQSQSNYIFILSALLFIIPVVACVMCLKNPPVYNFKEGDELRVEYRKKYKKGKIALLDIPAPIYESKEDIEERNKLISQAYNISEEEVTADE